MVKPRISVVIPTRNRMAGGLLQRSVESVLAQEVDGGFELIVVDDGSTDGTRDWLLARSGVKTVVGNARGAAVARNKGARVAVGRFLTFLDSDDEAEPGWLARHCDALKHAEIACCGYRLLDADGNDIRVVVPQMLEKPDDRIRGLFTKAGVFSLRRELFWKVNGYAEVLRSGQHTELSFRLLDRVKPAAVVSRPDADVNVHIHEGLRIRGDYAALAAGSSYVLSRHGERLLQSPGRYSRYSAVAAVNLARRGERRKAIKVLTSALRREPWFVRNWARVARVAIGL